WGGPPMEPTDVLADDVSMERSIAQLPPWARVIARVILALVISAGLGLVGFGLLFIGIVEVTGCFFECREPNTLAGLAALGGAALSGGVIAGTLDVGIRGWSGRVRFLRVVGLGTVVVSTVAIVVAAIST
ncbi:MAG: hypothetical protein R3246_15825, partial [Acidimicrobiia bacterium]|nr:hypothetical protein [Acidimicrobiia bacterium]